MTSAAPTPNTATATTTPPHLPPANHQPANPASPPNKRDLKSWWKGFKIPSKHQETHGSHPFRHYCRTTPSTRILLAPAFREELDEQVDSSPTILQSTLRMQDSHGRALVATASSDADPGCTSCCRTSLAKLFYRNKPGKRSIENPSTIQIPIIFRSFTKTSLTETRPQGIFGVPLRQSITYANVAISLIDENGKSYIYGYVPIVVAKCGVFLKEKGMYQVWLELSPILF
jgi:GTPase-activating protein SAC7